MEETITMPWITQIITWGAAIGIGGIIVKILDIIWLQKAIERREKNKWIRNKKFDAYTELLSIMRSHGMKPYKADLFEEQHILQIKKLLQKLFC